jgi:putative transposase
MQVFLDKLSEQYADDYIVLVVDGASWHTTQKLICPENIELFQLPPYTPEMNPIEQVWREIRTRGFRNEIFETLEDVVDRLCSTVCSLTDDVIKSITLRDWIKCIF